MGDTCQGGGAYILSKRAASVTEGYGTYQEEGTGGKIDDRCQQEGWKLNKSGAACRQEDGTYQKDWRH